MSSRVLDENRKSQGFKSQEHLDAFFEYFDHFQSCDKGCNTPGPSYWSEADASWQDTVNVCPEGMSLERAWWEFSSK